MRQAEASAAARLRAAGHDVITPDLYDGQTAGTMDAALALMDTVGWQAICARARRALQKVPGVPVLAGISMGAGAIGSVWDQRETAAGIVLLHGIAPVPANARAGLPVQVHLAEDDPFAPRQAVAQWQTDAARAGLAAQVFAYPGAGHFYTTRAWPATTQPQPTRPGNVSPHSWPPSNQHAPTRRYGRLAANAA